MLYETFEVYFVNFMLMFIRIGMLFVASPIFSRSNIPAMAKIGMSLLLTYILVNSVPLAQLPEQMPIIYYAVLCVMEAIVGLAFGFIIIMAFSLTMAAGQMIDVQMGFSMSQMYDPATMSQVPISGSLMNLILTISFFAANGHHRLIEMMYASFEVLPVANYSINSNAAWFVAEIFAQIFLIGIQISMPILVTSLLIESVLGIIVRNVPQMNMFVVGIPLKLLVGLALMFITLPLFVKSSNGIFAVMFEQLDRVIAAMKPA